MSIVNSGPASGNVDNDLDKLRAAGANVKHLDVVRLLGQGVQHAKLWTVDSQHAYLGSANMDWRSLTQVLSLLVPHCPTKSPFNATLVHLKPFLGEGAGRSIDRLPGIGVGFGQGHRGLCDGGGPRGGAPDQLATRVVDGVQPNQPTDSLGQRHPRKGLHHCKTVLINSNPQNYTHFSKKWAAAACSLHPKHLQVGP